MKKFASMMVSHPSVVLLNCHNENNYFDPNNAHGLPSLHRGVWMHASRAAMDLDHQSVKAIRDFFAHSFKQSPQVDPKVGILVNPETGAQFHPYFGYYYGEGSLDFYFLPSPRAEFGYPLYDNFSPSWGWREDAHPDSGVGAVPTTSYERVAGGGGFNQFGPDEFGFQGFSPNAVRLAVRDVLKKMYPDMAPAPLNDEVKRQIELIPWGYLYAPDKLPKPSQQTDRQKMFVKVIKKLEEHSLQAYTFPMWMKPEKPIDRITIEDVVDASQQYQAWGAQLCAEIYRRAGYGQTRFMFFGSEDDQEMLYSLDWGVTESNRTPKMAYHAVGRAYQPVLATSRILTRRLVPGEPWMDGLWLHNDTYYNLPELSVIITLRGPKGQILKEARLPGLGLKPYQIREMRGMVPDSFKTSGPKLRPGRYGLSLQVLDNSNRVISTNHYSLQVLPGDLLSGVKPVHQDAARKIMDKRYRQLEKHFRQLGLEIDDTDTWPRLIHKMRRLRTRNWETWRAQIQKDPETLLDFPEFSDRLKDLQNARYRLDSAGEQLMRLKENKRPSLKAETEMDEARKNYKKVLNHTKKTINLGRRDLHILMGRRGARIPIPLFYGSEITTDRWFEKMISDLEAEGAWPAANDLRKYYNCRESHWFDRQVKTYKVLQATLK